LRAYGQRDPLLEYRSESFTLFEQMILKARQETVTRFFRLEVAVAPRTDPALAGGAVRKDSAAPIGAAAPVEGAPPRAGSAGTGASAAGVFAQAQASKPTPEGVGDPGAERGTTVTRSMPKVGRNEPCPCGSGKKYKKCHGRNA
jgi:preprotein translocase subunit SecA